MPYIIGRLETRRGNITPSTLVVAREADDLISGDVAQATADKFGNYILNVALSATLYHLWVETQTSVQASNYIGIGMSTGNVVASFNLCSDSSWKEEHNGTGDPNPCGEHKATTHDSILLRANGFIQSTDSNLRLHVGGANEILDIVDNGTTFFFTPWVTSGNNTDIGLAEGPGGAGDITHFYFGTNKNRYIDSRGHFELGFDATTTGIIWSGLQLKERTEFLKRATFANTTAEYPTLTGYAGSYPSANDPTLNAQLTPKGYVDGAIAAAIPASPTCIAEDDSSICVADDGVSPGLITHTVDGNPVATESALGWTFGPNVASPDQYLHLRVADAEAAIRIQRTGVGNSTTDLTENSVGTVDGNNFYFKSNNNNAGMIDQSQYFGFNVFSGLTERVHVGGNVRLGDYLHISNLSTQPTTAADEAKLYLKARNANNNELAVTVKKNGAIEEILLTSPEGKCTVCGVEGSARDPYFDLANGKMIIQFYCGHSFEIDIKSKQRK